MDLNLDRLNILAKESRKLNIGSDSNSGKTLCVSEIISSYKENYNLVICENDKKALSTFKELSFFGGVHNSDILYFPDSETLPYDSESPHIGLTSERAKVIHKLMDSKQPLTVVLSLNNVSTKISGFNHWIESSFILKEGQEVNELKALVQKLEDLGYQEKEIEIDEIGEFSYRNNVLDIYPLGSQFPVRIKINNQRIYSIKELNLTNQLSNNLIGNILVPPAKEIPVGKDATILFRKKFREYFSKGIGNFIYDSVSSGNFPSGIEAYLPLFQEDHTDILSLILNKDKSAKCFLIGDIEKRIEQLEKETQDRYKSLVELENKLILNPSDIWVQKKDFYEKLNNFHLFNVREPHNSNNFNAEIKNTLIERKETLQATLDLLEDWVEKSNKIIFSLQSNVRDEQVKTIFDMLGCDIGNVKTWNEALSDNTLVSIINADIDNGFYIEDSSLLLITEKEIFGQPIFAKENNKIEKVNNFQAVQDLINLNLGDPIVHLKYGVGRFNGLEKTEIGGVEKEFMTITYAESAKIFVNMNELDLISRYAGSDYEKAPLDNISIDGKWIKSTKSAKNNVVSLAKSLLNIQAARKTQKGKIFKDEDYKYLKFSQEFPFQETVDQKSAVKDIIDDLKAGKIMDRVVCGDVGFGKTEVAMKTAFFVANNGYQVAILAPTTLLAQQHFENFKQRFSSFPEIKIRGLFGDNKQEEKTILSEISNGEADIIIGTHKLIQKSVKYKNLGIAIIDEEHRFGVKQKEFFRSARKDINLLSMTATPIPRTLSMSMHGIRDISIISTPPAKRLAIRTFLEVEGISVLSEAINREKRRGGQVFYLHNRTETIAAKAEQLEKLFPDLKIKYAHGKMKEAQLEKIMSEFYRGEFDILVSTTIIETGIDIPNANTILIEDAQNFGIAQLHQLRGRVGRSHHQAYCYLLKGEDMISETAEKRLKAMTKATKLGEGFILANHDLEIRGAGEILGEEQSGQIEKIGFALYLRLLERAIIAIKNGKDIDAALDLSQETLIDIGMSTFIESSFIENDRARLSFYKRIVSAESTFEIDEISTEIEDKYGEIPVITKRFIAINREKVEAKEIHIKKIMVSKEGTFVSIFDVKESLVIENMLDYIVSNNFNIKSPTSFHIDNSLKTEEERIAMVHTVIENLSKGIAA